jgi:SAM-dependent methyltransferase
MPLYRSIRRSRLWQAFTSAASRDDVHRYWQTPWDQDNAPDSYIPGEERSRFLVDIVRRHAAKGDRLLELGCNVGRNLHYLSVAGYQDLAAIEISEAAVRRMREVYPSTAARADIHLGALEEILPTLPHGSFDFVFTMAVLEHVHTDSEQLVFPNIARVTGHILVTIEDERGTSWRHFPRRYNQVFAAFGMQEVETISCNAVPGLGADFVARVFRTEPGARAHSG